METNSLIIILIIIIITLVIIFLKMNVRKKTTKIVASSHEELIEKMKENNFPQEMINEFENNGTSTPFSTYTTTSTSHKVTYINGEKVSEEKNSTHNIITPLTNCPNCGAKLKDKTKDHCEYCHTILTKK